MGIFNKIKSKVNDIIQPDDDGWEDFPSFLDDEDTLQKQNKHQDVPYYANIPLLDTGLIKEGGRVYDLLKKNGINTVGQILDDNLMEKVKQGTTYPENIDFLIDFIKNKYEGTSLKRTRFLDEKVITDKNISFDTFGLNCCNPNNFEYDYLIKVFKEEVELGNLSEDSKFIDFFRYLISDANRAKKIVPNKEIIILYVLDYDIYKRLHSTEDEKSKYDDILLKETGFYASYDNYLYATLKSKGITTVGQILDDNIMFGVKKHTKDIERLNIFIDIVKNQYLGIPLPQVAIFDEPIRNTKYVDFKKFLFIKKGYRQIYVDHGQFGFLGNLEKLSANKVFVNKNYETALKFAKHHGYLNDDSTYIDYFKFLLSEDNTWLDIKDQDIRVLEIYINEYEKQKHNSLDDSKKLNELKVELNKLNELRDNLDKQISEITKSIAEYEEKISSKGSM